MKNKAEYAVLQTGSGGVMYPDIQPSLLMLNTHMYTIKLLIISTIVQFKVFIYYITEINLC